jgi:hypothetical protein
MGKKIQPNYSMTEEEINEMVPLLESLPPQEEEGERWWYCDICHRISQHGLFHMAIVFNRENGEPLHLCNRCLNKVDESNYEIKFF